MTPSSALTLRGTSRTFASYPGGAADLARCEAILRQGSKSFHAASLLLPQRVRQPALALYAFCRGVDDAVDDVDLDASKRSGEAASTELAIRDAKLQACETLERRLRAVYAGCPEDRGVDRLFASLVEECSLPQALPEALLDGMRWDAEGRTYETLEEVHAYGARVAGTVGVMMTILMLGPASPSEGPVRQVLYARAADLGVAMQLTNISRDVGEDARMGRVYLPGTWLQDAGIDRDAFLANPRFSPALGSVVGRLLDEADRLYIRADAGIPGLPASCRPAIRAARHIYAAIGTIVRHRGLDSVSSRASTSTLRKLALVFRSLFPSRFPPEVQTAPPLVGTAFLVAASLPS